MSDTPEVMDEDMLMHRIKAHIASPDVYDPPTFKEMADRIKELEVRIDELEVVVKKLWSRQDSLDTFDAAVNDILSPLFEEQPHE